MVNPQQVARNLDIVQRHVDRAASAHGISKDLINGIIVRESKGLQNAVSPTGALGISQETYGIYGSDQAVKAFGTAINPFDAEAAIDRQASLLSDLNRHYHGNIDRVLAGYNQGQSVVDNAISEHGNGWLDHIPREGKNYVISIRGILSGGNNIPGYFGTKTEGN